MKSISTIEPFFVIGVAIRTSNKNEDGAAAIGNLWGKFYSENITAKIPNLLDQEVYSVYLDYESDYTGAYTCLIGMKVSSLAQVPEGLVGKEIGGGTYEKQIIKGDPMKSVGEAWREIWRNDASVHRRYTSDFEVYGPKSQQGEASEVEIFLAIDE